MKRICFSRFRMTEIPKTAFTEDVTSRSCQAHIGTIREALQFYEVKMRTLIVDDSSLMRKMVERALRLAGLNMDEVLQAGNGEEALQVLRNETTNGSVLNLIISDINMPVMDGLAFLEQRQKEKLAQGVPIIMITTEGSEAFVRRAIAAGATGYICKPFIPDQIRAKIQHLL